MWHMVFDPTNTTDAWISMEGDSWARGLSIAYSIALLVMISICLYSYPYNKLLLVLYFFSLSCRV